MLFSFVRTLLSKERGRKCIEIPYILQQIVSGKKLFRICLNASVNCFESNLYF